MRRVASIGLLITLIAFAGLAMAAAGDEIGRLVGLGDVEAARALIGSTLDSDSSDEQRARALRWLGRIEVGEENFPAALAAFRRLATELGRTAAAAEATTELALLEALAQGGFFEPAGGPAVAPLAEESEGVAALPAESAGAAPAVTAPSRPPKPLLAEPEPRPEPGAGKPPSVRPATPSHDRSAPRVLVGSIGKPFTSAETAAGQVTSFLEENGVEAVFESSASEALRGSDAVVAYLLSRAREAGAGNLVIVRSRWGFREFVSIECFTAEGTPLWREKVTGGTAHRSDEVTDLLMRKLWRKLWKRLGGPGLPQVAAAAE